MLKRIWNWLCQLLPGKALPYSAIIYPDPPDEPKARRLYLVGEPGDYWMACMRCPCGCGETISVSMTKNAKPRWGFEGSLERPSLHPSIWRKTGCKSHFFLRNGQIVWA